MKLPKPRMHLDRVEVIVMFSLVVLVAGMMFTLGVLVGNGVGSREGGAQLAHAAKEAAGDHHGVAVAHEKKHEEIRKPASIEKSSGSGLRKAFRESKQRALVDLSLKDNLATKPKSVLDTEAHFEAHNAWNRKPDSAKDPNDARNLEIEAARQVQEAREKSGVPGTVKGLFERKPNAVDHFVPRPGQYTIQIASFATSDESYTKIAQLRKSGFNDAYTEVIKKNGENWYRVNVGSYPNSAWARRTGEQVVRRKLASDYVVREIP